MTLKKIRVEWKTAGKTRNLSSRINTRRALLREFVAQNKDQSLLTLITGLDNEREREIIAFFFVEMLINVSLQRAREVAILLTPIMDSWLVFVNAFHIFNESRLLAHSAEDSAMVINYLKHAIDDKERLRCLAGHLKQPLANSARILIFALTGNVLYAGEALGLEL